MTVQHTELTRLRRPKLLLRAARHGLESFDRTRDLKRILGRAPRTTSEIDALLDRESGLDAARRTGDVSYAPHHHVAVMTAVLAEMCPEADADRQP
ncbi:DUF6477 family protein [Maritimibacter sp. UBA3975]|uniref:DUF6477 family protein n=1 Tax=Maritimibacter sp. UBA3975 TaxID=1946833 RepID=UPI000C0A607E|nr:DUF6477 family protein [Maritimibacter sp. UBA3975]MAM60534.1 hypothetical protein [Maritimibacter sp.]|tara:strand:- start:25206 stop:25493 length:288 start_codon:yes stop_codon:yes gene_type:complete